MATFIKAFKLARAEKVQLQDARVLELLVTSGRFGKALSHVDKTVKEVMCYDLTDQASKW